MDLFIKLFLTLFLLFSSLYSTEDIKVKELYLTYEEYPTRVFTGQKFTVTLKGIILKEKNSYDNIITKVSKEDNIELLTKEIYWKEGNSGAYTTSLTFKVYDKKFLMPTVTLALIKGEEVVDYVSAKKINIEYQNIAINKKNFSNIIAKDLKIISVKTKQYSNTLLHNTIHLEGLYSNFEDMKLSNYSEQGISSLTSEFPNQTLYYYLLTPVNEKEIEFSYYNTKEESFVKIKVPIILQEDLVSTQTELNPYNSNMLLYKQIFFCILLVLFLIFYLIRKNNSYLVIIGVLILIISYLFMPNKKILINENTKVYILPTNNSTVFKTLEKKYIVQLMNEKNGFVKVLFSNDNIGWIKTSDIE